MLTFKYWWHTHFESTVFFYLLLFFRSFIYLREREWEEGRDKKREREKAWSRLHAEIGVWHGARSYNLEITTRDETKNWMLKWLSPPGAPVFSLRRQCQTILCWYSAPKQLCFTFLCTAETGNLKTAFLRFPCQLVIKRPSLPGTKSF